MRARVAFGVPQRLPPASNDNRTTLSQRLRRPFYVVLGLTAFLLVLSAGLR